MVSEFTAVGNNPADLRRLGEMNAVGAILETATVMLFTNDVAITRGTLLADLDVPTYTGYAAEAVTLNAASENDAGQPERVGTLGEFRPTNGAGGPQSIWGAAILAEDGSLYAACRFTDGPYPMDDANDAILLVVRLKVDGTVGIVVVS